MCNQSNLADTKLGIRILGEISAYPSLRHSDFEGPRHSLPRNETAAELIQLSMEDAVPIQCTRIDGSIHHSPTAQLSRLYFPTVLITHTHTHTHTHQFDRPMSRQHIQMSPPGKFNQNAFTYSGTHYQLKAYLCATRLPAASSRLIWRACSDDQDSTQSQHLSVITQHSLAGGINIEHWGHK